MAYSQAAKSPCVRQQSRWVVIQTLRQNIGSSNFSSRAILSSLS